MPDPFGALVSHRMMKAARTAAPAASGQRRRVVGFDPDKDRRESHGCDHREVGQLARGNVQAHRREHGERDRGGRRDDRAVDLHAGGHPDQQGADADGQGGQDGVHRPSCRGDRKHEHSRRDGHADESRSYLPDTPGHGQLQWMVHLIPHSLIRTRSPGPPDPSNRPQYQFNCGRSPAE